MTKVIKHASRIYTGLGFLKTNGIRPKYEDLGVIEDGALVYRGSEILWAGTSSELPLEYSSIEALDLKLKQAIMPGLIDSHTHLVFAGNRAQEFARRCSGVSYETIAKEGGGILTTVKATRNATLAELIELAIPRVQKSFSMGVRTIEIKSGYGLDLKTELKILQVIPELQKIFPQMTLIPTFMGAHDFPQEISREEYINLVLNEMIPEVSKQKLAIFCDLFMDQGFYNETQAIKIAEQAHKYRLKLKVHADELYNTEAARFACQMGAYSADHLLKISDLGISALSQNHKTVATLLPGTAFYLKTNQAPARKMIDKGVKVALATDYNPGTCTTLNIPSLMTLSALYQGLEPAELFAAVTFNAASALDLQRQKSVIDKGYTSDFIILPYSTFEELYYHFA